MGVQVTAGAMLQCTFGMAPSSLVVLPTNLVTAGGAPAATIMDHIPITNIPPFGMCLCPANPAVAAATAAALGVLTPMPCLPVVPAPWTPGVPTVTIGKLPALDNTSQALCIWGGMIAITTPSQVTVMVP